MNSDERTISCEGVHCDLVIECPADGVVVVRLAGWDAGEFGDLPMNELTRDIADDRVIQLFIDARNVKGASIEVSGEWAQWLSEHRSRFNHVSMLTGSRLVELTARFVRRFAELGDVMKIYTDSAVFDTALVHSIDHARQRV